MRSRLASRLSSRMESCVSRTSVLLVAVFLLGARAACGQAHTSKPIAGRPAPVGTERPGSKLNIVMTDTETQAPTIMREVYAYPRDGRRDPFVSLLTTTELRPAMSDLRLTTILFDQSGNRSVAMLRDLTTNAQYRVTTGSTLGRMRVSAIRVKSVVFTIDEFGTTRQDSLVLGDSTKVRRQ